MVLLLTFSIGCINMGQSTNHALSVITTSTDLYYYYDSGEVVNFLDYANLSDLELTQILEALDQVDRSKSKLLLYKDQPILLIDDITRISFQYVKIKSSYLSVRSVVSDHWDEYTVEQQQVFLLFDRYASKLDDDFTKLNQSIESDLAIQTALALASTALKLSAIL